MARTEVGSASEAPAVVIETGRQPVASVIWLHGLGADGHDFEPIVPELQLPPALPLRFIFPHAPYRPVTWNNGYVMRAWYDIGMTQRGFYQNLEQLREAEAIVHGHIAAERARGIAASRIVLAGFSQGGAVVMHAGFRYAEPLAGIICLSAPTPYLDQLIAETPAANTGVPAFLAHGEHDEAVPYVLGQHAHAALAAAGRTVEWHSYPMGHGVCAQEIADISAWLAHLA